MRLREFSNELIAFVDISTHKNTALRPFFAKFPVIFPDTREFGASSRMTALTANKIK